jgi:hypothetical protein
MARALTLRSRSIMAPKAGQWMSGLGSILLKNSTLGCWSAAWGRAEVQGSGSSVPLRWPWLPLRE